MTFVRGVIACRTRSGSSAKPLVERAIEPDRARAEHPRRPEQRVVARTLDQHVVSRLEQRREHQEVRARRAARGRHAIGIDAVPRADGLDQRPIPVVVRAVKSTALARPGRSSSEHARMLLPARSNSAAARVFAHSM